MKPIGEKAVLIEAILAHMAGNAVQRITICAFRLNSRILPGVPILKGRG
jgi:hypothetical protein